MFAARNCLLRCAGERVAEAGRDDSQEEEASPAPVSLSTTHAYNEGDTGLPMWLKKEAFTSDDFDSDNYIASLRRYVSPVLSSFARTILRAGDSTDPFTFLHAASAGYNEE